VLLEFHFSQRFMNERQKSTLNDTRGIINMTGAFDDIFFSVNKRHSVTITYTLCTFLNFPPTANEVTALQYRLAGNLISVYTHTHICTRKLHNHFDSLIFVENVTLDLFIFIHFSHSIVSFPSNIAISFVQVFSDNCQALGPSRILSPQCLQVSRKFAGCLYPWAIELDQAVRAFLVCSCRSTVRSKAAIIFCAFLRL